MPVEKHYPTCKKCFTEGPHVTELYIEAREEIIPLCTTCQYNFLSWMFHWDNGDYPETLNAFYKYMEEF